MKDKNEKFREITSFIYMLVIMKRQHLYSKRSKQIFVRKRCKKKYFEMLLCPSCILYIYERTNNVLQMVMSLLHIPKKTYEHYCMYIEGKNHCETLIQRKTAWILCDEDERNWLVPLCLKK